MIELHTKNHVTRNVWQHVLNSVWRNNWRNFKFSCYDCAAESTSYPIWLDLENHTKLK